MPGISSLMCLPLPRDNHHQSFQGRHVEAALLSPCTLGETSSPFSDMIPIL
jgi:hypothetical protein